VLGLPRRDEPEDHRRLSLSLAKNAAAFLRISRSSVSVSDLTAQAAQLVALVRGQAIGLALVDVELARPVAQRLRRAPKLLASCEIDRPVVCSRRTASRRNSSEYGGMDGMDIDPRCRARRPSDQVSTKQ
jgi:hypothetical protein